MNKLDLGDILPYIPGGISNLLPVHTNLRSFGGMVTFCVGKRSNPMDPSVFLVGGFGFELYMLTVMDVDCDNVPSCVCVSCVFRL